jgi:hypothetical protein
MIAKHTRTPSTLFFAALFFVLCCGRGQAATDCKATLVSSLKGYDVSGYLFGVDEDEGQTASFLTNKAVFDAPIVLNQGNSDLVLRYTQIVNKTTGATTTYRSEIIKQDSSLNFVITDLGTNKTLSKVALAPSGPGCEPAGTFASITACINQFNCAERGPLQCTANQTCQPQFPALTCCLTNGSAYSVHLIIPPTSPHCALRDVMVDVGGLAFSPN